MAYALNTSHALYGNLIELIGVDSGALVSLKTARTFTKHADASFVTGGTYGEAFRSVAGGFTAKGASFTPSLSINTTANPAMTLFVVTNAVTHAGGGGNRCLVSGTSQATIGLNGTSGAPSAYTGSGTTAVIAGSASVSGTPAVLALTRTATASELYSSGSLVASGGVVGTNGTQTFNYLMGQSGAASLAGDLVWMGWFDKILSEAEIDDLIASLGASNAFGLVSAGGGSVSVETSATVSPPVFSGGVIVSPAVQLSATATLPVFSGSISFGNTVVEFNFNPLLPVFSGSITVSTGGATISITDLKDLTTGALRVGETGITAIISNVSTGVLVALLTGQTSTAGGDMSLSHASLAAAAWYRVTIILADGSEGTWKYQAA